MDLDLATTDKVVLTVAPTSGIHGRETSPHLPEQPEEIVEEVYWAYEAGASVAHIHVRDRAGRITNDPSIHGEVIARIRERCDIVIQLDNIVGGNFDHTGKMGLWPFHERLKLLQTDPRPDMISLLSGTFTSTSAGKGEREVVNPPSFIEEFARGCVERGIGLEFEVTELSQVHTIMELAAKGVIPRPLNWCFLLRGGNTLPPRPEHLMHLLQIIPSGSTWQGVGVGRFQLPLAVLSLTLGGRVRVGLEDNVYYRKGVPAKSSTLLVERIVQFAREMDREIATPADARRILGNG